LNKTNGFKDNYNIIITILVLILISITVTVFYVIYDIQTKNAEEIKIWKGLDCNDKHNYLSEKNLNTKQNEQFYREYVLDCDNPEQRYIVLQNQLEQTKNQLEQTEKKLDYKRQELKDIILKYKINNCRGTGSGGECPP